MVRIDFNRLRFLVIDDNAHMRRIVRTLLHGFGARDVYEAEDGAAGLDAFTHHVPDIVLTDWAMPIFDGLELTQMIRQPGANANPFVPIIMVTGHTEKERVTAARDAGVTEFLAKPISAKALYQRIVNVVANPRPFIKTKTYFGPDRRRNADCELRRPRTAQGRQGGRHPPAGAARQSQGARMMAPSGEYRNMASAKPSKPDVVTYGDHEMITPDTSKLRKTLRPAAPGEQDPVARAEEALAQISGDFSNWMQRRMRRGSTPPAARSGKSGLSKETRQELFLAAHDVKGDSGTLRISGGGAGRRQPVPAARAHPRSRQDSAGDRRSACRRGARDRARTRPRRTSPRSPRR